MKAQSVTTSQGRSWVGSSNQTHTWAFSQKIAHHASAFVNKLRKAALGMLVLSVLLHVRCKVLNSLSVNRHFMPVKTVKT
jgi:hypothetical protein